MNVYGTFYLPEILEKTRDKFTDKEYRRLKFYMESTGETTYKAAPNIHYCYDNSFTIYYAEDIYYSAQDYKNFDAATVDKFNDAIREYIGAFCSTWEKYGYEYLYEISNEEMADTCDANGWEFFEDGSIA